MRKNYKYLLKNVGLLSVSQLGTRIIGFFLVPLYTNLLSTEEYGTYDLYSTTINLLIPILTLNIMQSIMRFSLEKECDKQAIISSGIDIFTKGMFVFAGLVIVNYQFNLFPIINQYLLIFILLYVFSSLQQMLTFLARGLDNIGAISIGGLINSSVMLSLNVLFLVPMHLGLVGYFYASIIGLAVSNIYMILTTKIWRYIEVKKINRSLQKNMLLYSSPLILNAIAWWINNASDRYVIIALCSISANGVYSVAYKIPNILSMFQNVFNQAWTLSAVKDYDYNDSNGFFSKMYNTYNLMMVLICSALIVGDRIIAKLLYAKDFYEAWKYAPFLLIAVVFGALSGYIGGIFSAVKDSKVFAQSTVVGAVVNIILNLALVTLMGPIGAAISTAVSFLLVWIIRYIKLKQYIRMRVKIVRDSLCYIILFFQATILLFLYDHLLIMYSIELALFMIIVIAYKDEILSAFSIILNRKNNKKR